MTFRELPRSVEDLTTAWFSQALSIPVVASQLKEVIWGTATKARFALAVGPAAANTQLSVCVKGAFGERFDGDLGVQSPYALEARFYSDIAPHVSSGVPDALYAVADMSGQGIVILPDLSFEGRFGDPCSPLDAGQVAQALEVQAGWHAIDSSASSLRLDTFPLFSASRLAGDLLLSAPAWEAHFALDTSPVLPHSLNDRDKVLDAFRRLWEFEDRSPSTLVHGDAHLGNTHIDPDGRVSFLDWQGVCNGAWSLDVAYFIVGALSVEDRRSHERSLLDHYRRALAAAGGPDLDLKEVWKAYRRHCLHGLLWAVTPDWMQPPDRCGAMTERYVAAIEDHDSLSML